MAHHVLRFYLLVVSCHVKLYSLLFNKYGRESKSSGYKVNLEKGMENAIISAQLKKEFFGYLAAI